MLFAALALAAAQPNQVILAGFVPMGFLVGHCWRAEIAPRRTDTHCFEIAYRGHFIRDRHRDTGGYEGETLYNWDRAAGRVDYTYWNSDGDVMQGTMRDHDGLLDFGEQVHRGAVGGETRVSTTWRQLDETSYEVRAVAGGVAPRITRYTLVDAPPGATAP